MTANTVRTQVLEPALDAQAHNQRQQLLVANSTAEADSLVEHVTEIARLATPEQRPHLIAMYELMRSLIASNRDEGACEHLIAGVADQLTTDLRRAELNGPTVAWSAKRIAKALRAPLANLCNPTVSGDRRDESIGLVREVVEQAPRTLVLSVTVRHELGLKKYTRLARLVDEWTVA